MEEKLVLAVTVYPELYDMSDTNYHYKDRKKSPFVGTDWPDAESCCGECCAFITLCIVSLLLAVESTPLLT